MRTSVASMVAGICLLGVAGCCCPLTERMQSTSSPTPAPSWPPTTSAPPGSPQTPPSGPVTIGPPSSPGSGPYDVTSGGRNVWPPQGPGCERYVTCCNAASAVNSAVSLSCRLGVARQPVDCNQALTSVRNIMREMNVAEPPACAGP